MKSFLSGKKELTLPALCRPQAPAAVRAASASRPLAAEGDHNPNIEAVKEGEKIVRLIVTCGCGERMEIECIYPAGRG